MTLIFVGHQPQRTFDSGLFVIGDSAITSGTRTLLSGFKKVYPLPIKLWKPTITGGQSRGYRLIYQEQEGFAAFAGSTLTSQHYLNAVIEHLSNLRISSEKEGPFKLKVKWPCHVNPIMDYSIRWDDNLFVQDEYRTLLTEELIVETVQHALEAAVSSAKRYRLDEESFNLLLNEFAFGFRDPQDYSNFCLYHFWMTREQVDFIAQVKVNHLKVGCQDLIVLGMEKKFGASARQAFGAALASNADVETVLWNHLESAIESVKSSGESGIDQPIVRWHLDSSSPRLRLMQKSRASDLEQNDF
jgi:hypothetical protein